MADFVFLSSLRNVKILGNTQLHLPLKGGDPAPGSPRATLLRLHPSYQPYLGSLHLRKVCSTTSGTTNFRGVTGGVYKARERIHRGMLIHDY